MSENQSGSSDPGLGLRFRLHYALYKVCLKLHILRIDISTGDLGREDDGTLIVSLVAEPRWCWQKRNQSSVV